MNFSIVYYWSQLSNSKYNLEKKDLSIYSLSNVWKI